MTDFVVREARPEEYDAVGDVLEDAFTHGCWVTEEYRKGLHTIAERAQHSRVWVAESPDHELVGAVLTPRQIKDGVSTFNILGVSQKGRGHGLGHRLVEHAVAQAEAEGADCIAINSSPHMTFAHSLYYQHGFVRRPERETAVVDSGQRLYAFSRRLRPGPVRKTRRLGVKMDKLNARGSHELADSVRALADAIARNHGFEKAVTQVGVELDRDVIEVLDPIAANQVEALIRVFYARLGYYDYLFESGEDFLGGDSPTWDDVRLFAVLVLFDLKFRQHFGWGAASIRDYPHLWNYAHNLAHGYGFLSQEVREDIGLLIDPTEEPSPGPSLTTGSSHNDLVNAWLEPLSV